MKNIITLICNPSTVNLEQDHVSLVLKTLREMNARTTNPDWLTRGVACDIPFENLGLKKADTAIKKVLKNFQIDIISQKNFNRKKKLLIADMDATIILGETLDNLATLANCKEKVAKITEQAMNGEIHFVEAIKRRIELLKGLSLENLEKAKAEIELTPGAGELVQTMKANGAVTMLISGGLSIFTDHVRQLIGFDKAKGNDFEMVDNKLTGRLIEPVINKDAKLENFKLFAATNHISSADTIAVGDGANDIPMLLEAGTAIAFHAKPIVNETIDLSIKYSDLTALLYIQGYRSSDFV